MNRRVLRPAAVLAALALVAGLAACDADSSPTGPVPDDATLLKSVIPMGGGHMMGGGGPGSGPHMGDGWSHANGSYGMVFSFTTAG